MSYLKKDERREEILQAAMRVALAEGFPAMTVRRIASEANVATGQVHHHFASAGELKAQAFIRLTRTLLEANPLPESATWRERLCSILGSDDGGFEPYIRLWREAQLIAAKDPDIKAAYILTMRIWQEGTAAIILQGHAAREFTLRDSAENIAWRLIALVCGLDGMYALGMEDINDDAFDRHLEAAVTLELF